MNPTCPRLLAPAAFAWILVAGHFATSVLAQSIAPVTSISASPAQARPGDDAVQLSPFVVSAGGESGYMATSTLAGTRLRTNLSDVGASISVLTAEFLADIGATDNQSALTYALNTEVYGVSGNYQNAPNTGSWGQTAETDSQFNPNSTTRVRGLVSADNTTNYFRSNVAWDSYNVSRIDMLRGSNSILFGLGSPGGVINSGTDTANLARNSGQANVTTDEFGSFRSSFNYNQVIAKGQLAVRVAALHRADRFKQKPANDNEDRLFLTGKYRPAFLNKRDMTLEVVADFQRGLGTSNRPRTAPPLDYVTGWVQPVSTQPIQLKAGTNFTNIPNGLIPAYTQFANKAGVTFLQNVGRTFDPAIGLWADAFGPRLTVNSANGPDFWRQGRVWVEGVLQANGTAYFGDPQASRRLFGYGNAFQDTPLQQFNSYLLARGHPFANAFIPTQITNPSVYDFYHRLLDGPNKEEWGDFNQFRVVLANTFLKQKLGYEVSYFREDSTRGQTTFLSDVARIFVDTQLEDIEGRRNPDFGRPYLQETTFNGNRVRRSLLDAYRVSAYLDHNFASADRASWWRRIVGRQVLNGAYSQDTAFSDTRNLQRYVLGPEFVARSPNNPVFNNRTRVSVRYYVGDSLLNRTAIAGANISNLDRYVMPSGGTINLRYFDTTWRAPATVSPAAAWVNPLNQTWEQAANPANYAGWTTAPYTIKDAFSGNPGDMEAATRGATLQRNKAQSRVFTWQGYLLDGLVVATYGRREDYSKSATFNGDTLPPPYNATNVSPASYTLSNPAAARDLLNGNSASYGAVLHLHRLPQLGRKLPLNVSLTYNQGENFNPTAGRRDVNGAFMAAPQGATKEYGVLFTTADQRYSLRVQRYETSVLNATSTQIANANFAFNQFLSLNPRNAITDIENGAMRAYYNGLVNRPAWNIDDQERVSGPAWRQFERNFAAAFPGFIKSWLNEGTWAPMGPNTTFAPAFANTEDSVSKGAEIEFTLNPTRSLRLTFNAAWTDTVRTNVPGPSTRALYEFIQSAMVNPDGTPTAAGAMRSGFDPLNTNMATFWTVQNWIPYGVTQQLNGQPAPELARSRANAVANYTFRTGRLNGFGIGGAARYEAGGPVGFPYYFDRNGTRTLDLESPFKRGANTRYDLWFSYRRRLFRESVDWSVQLNLPNILKEDELIPVRANPDGTMANFRIQQGRTWRLSSTFRF